MVNLEGAIIATKKMSDTLETGWGAPPRGLTPAEDPALALNRGRPLVEGIEGGTSSQCVPQELREPFIQGGLLLTACLAYQLPFSWLYFNCMIIL